MRAFHTDHGMRVGPLQVSILYTHDGGAALSLTTKCGRHIEVHVSTGGRSLWATEPVTLPKDHYLREHFEKEG